MEIQVRIAYETAEMLEQLKDYYEKKSDINFTKSEVLSRAVIDTYELWKDTDWNNINVEVKEFNLLNGSLRPKFQISLDIEEKINELKKIITNYLELGKIITVGATFKYILKLALSQIQKKEKITVDKILFETLNEFEKKNYPPEIMLIINSYFDKVMLKLEENNLI